MCGDDPNNKLPPQRPANLGSQCVWKTRNPHDQRRRRIRNKLFIRFPCRLFLVNPSITSTSPEIVSVSFLIIQQVTLSLAYRCTERLYHPDYDQTYLRH